MLSIAILQLCRGADFCNRHEDYSSLGQARLRLAKCFVEQFKGRWDPLSRSRWAGRYERLAGSANFDRLRCNNFVIQYHMRAFTVRPPAAKLGKGLKRAEGTFWIEVDSPEGDPFHKRLRLGEFRCSVGLKTTWRLDFPVFSLVTLADETVIDLEKISQLGDADRWDKAGIHPSIRATGMAAFAFRIHSLLPQWEKQWSYLIDEIGAFLGAEVSYHYYYLTLSTDRLLPR
jgi:hypothetical protein